MASERERILVNVFLALAGEGWRGVLGDLLGLPMEEGPGGGAAQASRPGGKRTGGSGSSAAETVLSYASLGTVPLAKALIGLFTGGGEREQPATLADLVMPRRLQFEAGIAGREMAGVDYDQFGMPRVGVGNRGLGIGTSRRMRSGPAGEPGEAATWREEDSAPMGRADEEVSGREEGWASVPGRARTTRLEAAEAMPPRDWAGARGADSGGVVERVIAPQVTVQVQAMDSRSFLDRSDDIARAVREAMLNMHSLNDVVSEL